VKHKINFEKFVLQWLELSEDTCIGNLDIQAQDPTTSIEDVNIVIVSCKNKIKYWRFGQHKERDKAFYELQHCKHR
jgi:hypothetical protein